MDIATLTQAEVEDALRLLNARLEQIRLDARNAQDDRTSRITDAVATLDALLGPEDAEPGVESIRAVRGYDGQTMADNAAIALPLAFEGLEILAATVRDIAKTIATKQ